uniref:hypothetical protein n=1 Tax=Acinetobacter baumannii TaxID=470 RepID=UPI00197AF926
VKSTSKENVVNDRGIYLLQTININSKRFTIFYDNLCSDFVISPQPVKMLGSNAVKESSQTIKFGGVGDTITESSLGIYCANLPLFNGQIAVLS